MSADDGRRSGTGPAPAAASTRSVVVALGGRRGPPAAPQPAALGRVGAGRGPRLDDRCESPDDWSGARYQSAPILVGPLLVVISMWSPAASTASAWASPPRRPSARASARPAGWSAPSCWWPWWPFSPSPVRVAARRYGGFDLGDEPGRTLHAQFTLPELLQPVALALLAVAVGRGRRPPAPAPGHRDAAAVRRLVPVRDRVLGVPGPPDDAVLDPPDPAGLGGRGSRHREPAGLPLGSGCCPPPAPTRTTGHGWSSPGSWRPGTSSGCSGSPASSSPSRSPVAGVRRSSARVGRCWRSPAW